MNIEGRKIIGETKGGGTLHGDSQNLYAYSFSFLYGRRSTLVDVCMYVISIMHLDM